MRPGLDLLQGTLDVLILRALSRARDQHGYSVARWIRERSSDELLVEEGALYPALHRLEERGLIESEWGLSENNRRARFYRLTASGQKAFREETVQWHRYAAAVNCVLAP